MFIVVFLGPPGSGKGTQATMISEALKLPYLSTGDILREAAKKDNDNSVALRECMANGKLVSSDLVNAIVDDTLHQAEFSAGCILDGYPRNLNQAEFLDKNFPDAKVKVVYFDIAYDTLVERVTGRFSCAKCGAIYNKFLAPTKALNKCDKCDSREFKVREDDKVEVLRKRWNEYSKETTPLVDYYTKKSAIIGVDATLKKEAIADKLLEQLR